MVLNMKKSFLTPLALIVSMFMLTACGEDEPQLQPQSPLPQAAVPASAPVTQQPQVVYVEKESDDGLSAGEAMLVGAAAGAIAGNLTSGSRDVHHYHHDSRPTYSSSSNTSYKPKTSSSTKTTYIPSNVNSKINSVNTSAKTPANKPVSFNLTKPSDTKRPSSSTSSGFKSKSSSSSSWSSSSRSSSSSSGFKSKSRR